MKIQLKKDGVSIDYETISEFCKAASHIKDATFVYLRYTGTAIEFYTEGQSSTAYVTMPASNPDLEHFSAGFTRDRFVDLFKKMYEGQVHFRILKKDVEVKLDNIKAKLPIASPRSRSKAPDLLTVIDDDLIVDELVSKFVNCTYIDEDKKGLDKKFSGVLFDNSDYLRICKFSARSLILSTTPSIFQVPYRVVLSDEFAKAVRTFRKEIKSIAFTASHSVLLLKNSTVVYFSLMHDSYPLEYLDTWGFGKGASLVPESAERYTFLKESFIGAVDLIGTALGDTEHWVSLETIGMTGSSLIWRFSGKSHTGMEIQEDIASTSGSAVEKFQVQKKTLLGLLALYDQNVNLCDFSSSFTALANEEGTVISILLKSAR